MLTPRITDEECYHNLYKSLHGFRPRHVADMSDDELSQAIESISAEIERLFEAEAEAKEDEYILSRAEMEAERRGY